MPAKANDLAAFKSAHDPAVVIPNKIRSALEVLRKDGPEAWAYEQDFLTKARINAAQVSNFREQFNDHIVVVKMNGRDKLVWFADSKVAKKARGD